jgi:hypothetical protein
LCKRDCRRASNTARRARDECDLAYETLSVMGGHVLLLISL